MIVSDARREANRRNAQLSTGPKTPEGKERSRANALKHGLCSAIVVAEDLEAVQERAASYFQSLKPQNPYHCWVVNQVAVLSLRVDRCQRIERRIRDRSALRAELCWDDDRRAEASAEGSQLPRRPEEVSEALMRSPQGCDWLIKRWAMLAHAADVKGGWTSDQARLAFDLLGTPAEFREGHKPGAELDRQGRVVEPADDPAAVARREIAALEGRRELAVGLDEVDRSLAHSDLTDEADPELRRLRRYESALHRRLRWCLSQLAYQSPHRAPHPDAYPRWEAVEPEKEPKPEAKPEPAPTPSKSPEFWEVACPCPPFDLEPHEAPGPGEALDVPKILAGRAEQRLKRAEARREARRRKLERLRA